jgi:hypothetical protein
MSEVLVSTDWVAQHAHDATADLERYLRGTEYDQISWLTYRPFQVAYDRVNNKYNYSNLKSTNPTTVDILQSVWRVSLGLMYDF